MVISHSHRHEQVQIKTQPCHGKANTGSSPKQGASHGPSERCLQWDLAQHTQSAAQGYL